MSAEEFAKSIKTATTTVQLERLVQLWRQVKATSKERDELRAKWCGRWDDLATRQCLVLASQLGSV